MGVRAVFLGNLPPKGDAEVNWVHPPERVRRFSIHQLAQHGAATVLWLVLTVSAISMSIGAGRWGEVHVGVGIVASAFFLYHLLYLVVTGIRYDLPFGKVACVPSGPEWSWLRTGAPDSIPVGKYSPVEKGDFLTLLLWSLPLVGSGILLRWPGLLGIPGPGAYSWIRVVHAGCGAAITLHILLRHIPDRWVRMPGPFRMAVVNGTVPLEYAEERRGWVEELVAAGVLVPLPEEPVPEVELDSRTVRDLFEAGNRLAREGRFGDASESFEEALRLYPQYSQARFNLAVARAKEGRNDLAEEQILRFLRDDPFNPMVEKARELLESLQGRHGRESP